MVKVVKTANPMLYCIFVCIGTEVMLAVQCEDGRRVQGKFDPSSTSLWGVLTKLGLCEFEGGRLEPVVAYTNNQVSG